MDRREVEQIVDSKLRVMEDRLTRYIDNKLNDKNSKQKYEIVSAENKIKTEVRRELVAYVNKHVGSQLQEMKQDIARIQVDSDGQELLTEYRRRLHTEIHGPIDEKSSAQQGPRFFFSEND